MSGKLEEVRIGDMGKRRLREILRELRGKRVLVVGDVGVDRYTHGVVERISPEAPVPIVLVEHEQHKLGLAANVADNLKVLGGEPLLVGVVGRDRGAQDFRKLLRSSGIAPAHLIEDPARRTVLKERIVSDRQQLLRVDYESLGPVGPLTNRKVLTLVARLMARADAVIVEDYAKGLLDRAAFAQIYRLAKRAGKIAATDPNAKTPATHYRGAWVLTPNTREAEALAGFRIRDASTLLRAGKVMLDATSARHVVVTRGKEGMAIFSRGVQGARLIPTYAREVYDVSGAGDTVIAVLTLALSAGASIVEAAVLGNVAAGIEVAKRGTATVASEEILQELDRHFEI